MDDRRITLAAIAGAHGIGGEVRLKLFAESVESLKQYKTFDVGGKTLTLRSVRQTGKMPVARFAEITDRNGAESLRGTELSVDREDLPPLENGEYYFSDIVGLNCMSSDGEAIGAVVGVENFGAGDIADIEKPDGKTFMVPLKHCTIETDHLTVDSDFVQ